MQEEKRAVHTSSLTGAMKIKEVLEGHEIWSKVEFRMEQDIFRAIVSSVDEPVLHVPRAGSEINVARPSVGSETNVAGLTLDREACEVQSPPSGTSVHGSGKKRKKSQVASVLDDYLEHKKNQTDKTMDAFLEKKTRGEESIDRCIHIFEAMEDLTDEEKAIAAEVFENELYREMFLKLTIHNVRLIWLRRKIRF
ncbi:uncharacterized protein [Zea mays]|uniref:uncharacterized protein n=1 Tax=Zea mays TaxID=4577 RepID=UPI0009AA25E1|nr:uncharacterized protein LOC109942543 [Zea mays]|eukprot:XP_020400210.1 uncharacterized protein LOC109942543 [Zea mays]